MVLVLLLMSTIRIYLTSSQSLGYAFWNFNQPSNGYETLYGQINVLSDPGTSSDGLFMSHQFFFKNGNGGYYGLQTVGTYDAPLRILNENGEITRLIKVPSNTKLITDKPLSGSGKIAIFSIWSSLDCEIGGDSSDYECVHGNESGEFYSIHMNYQWTQNDYTLILGKNESDSNGMWWSVNILSTKDNNLTPMGRIKVPNTWGNIIGTRTDGFLEKYTGTNGCNGNFPNYAGFSYYQSFDGTIYKPYNSSYIIGDNGVKCPCVIANNTIDYNVNYIINKALGGCD